MSTIHEQTFAEVCNEIDFSVIDQEVYRRAIKEVYGKWISDLKDGKVTKIVFHAYFGLVLLELGIDDLFQAERYRKALGAYFNKRAVAAKKSRRQHPAPNNRVEECSKQHAKIRAMDGISLTFSAKETTGKVDSNNDLILTDRTVYFGHWRVPSPQYGRAVARAIAVINDKRGY